MRRSACTRAGAEKSAQSSVAQQAALTSKQKAATGPFLAYVNLCKPLLQVWPFTIDPPEPPACPFLTSWSSPPDPLVSCSSPSDLLPQAKRPDLSLLEVLKELASQWNDMSRQEKQKFAVIAKESEDKQELSAISFATQEAGEDRGEKEEEEVEGEEELVTGRNSRGKIGYYQKGHACNGSV